MIEQFVGIEMKIVDGMKQVVSDILVGKIVKLGFVAGYEGDVEGFDDAYGKIGEVEAVDVDEDFRVVIQVRWEGKSGDIGGWAQAYLDEVDWEGTEIEMERLERV
jgi:hypothetical protein